MLKSVMVIFLTVTLFACDGTYKDIQQLSKKDDLPAGEVIQFNLVYTDTGKVVTNVLAPLMLDYSNLDFAYREFPEGVEVRFYDKGERNTVTSDYAMEYPDTGIVDLRDNVVLVTAGGEVLTAEQLYWDQKNKWVFTDRPYRITFKDGSYNDGARFDANENFTVFLSHNNDGIQIVDQAKTLEPNGE